MANLESELAKLESADLIRESPQEIDPAYIFKHALTQDAAYGSMLKSRRSQLHRQVAEAIETLSHNPVEQDAAMLALHYEQAGIDDKAFTYAAIAGDAAGRAFAHQEALAFYDRALALAEHLTDPRIRSVFGNRGRVFELMGNFPQAIENYRAMIAFAQRRGDPAMEADALNRLLTAQGVSGEVPDAERQLNRALDLARQSGDPTLIVRSLWNIGLSIRFKDLSRAAQYFRQALDQARAAGLRELAAYTLLDLNVETTLGGQWRAALDYARQALELFRALDNQPMIANALGALSRICYGRGETSQARAAGEEGLRISQTIQNPWGVGYNGWHLLAMDTDAGDFDRALMRGQTILGATERLGIPLFAGVSKVWLARLHLELNQLDSAQTLADEGTRSLDLIHAPVWSTVARGMQALVAVQRQMLDRAHDLLDPIWQEGDNPTNNTWGFASAGPAIAELALTEQRFDFGLHFCDWLISRFEPEEMWRHVAEMRYYRARLRLAQGDLAGAETDLTLARDISETAKTRILLWRIDAALTDLYTRRGDAEHAEAARHRAIDLVHALAIQISDEGMRDVFMHHCDVVSALGLLKFDEDR